MKHEHNEFGRPASEATIEARRPKWRRIHHDWRFWVGLVLILAAMVIYIMSQDLSMRPHGKLQPPVPENVAP
ncbi:MAG: hypothetical protein ABI444_09970 [Candidatus Kapaibacterium sp.]|jgi:hypothetical protein